MDVEEGGSYTPTCDEALKPVKGKQFITLEDGVQFYKQYAREAGFDARMSTVKKSGDTIMSRYVVCSREGEKHSAVDVGNEEEDALSKVRRRLSMRCSCPAKVVFKFNGLLGYVVHLFGEKHNHPLVEGEHKQFLKINRNLDHMHQKFILDCASASIGPTHSYKLLMELLGSHDGVGCSLLDVRNFTRDMKAYVEGSDAQMLLNEMSRKKKMCEAFTYNFEVDGDDKLKRVFWCDPIAKRNYHMFGDVVAFDTTYSTNKYCMVFAPFTGVNNHGKPVTFGAGLLSGEDAASFSWLFEKFVECMGSAPSLIITDQDLGMKAAIKRVLVGTRHRWCMWHIMVKLAEKVPKELHADEMFKKDLNAYVWSEINEPEVFEEGWNCIMQNYGLLDHEWFESMFEARNYWVPSYFRDFNKSGLVRTTSISESENVFYKRYARSRSNLLEFWMNYNHALDGQRHTFSHMNYIDKTVVPTLATKSNLEKHASLLYTTEMFRFVQGEISSACDKCCLIDIQKGATVDEFKIRDEFGELCTVTHNKNEESFVCCCKLFVRKAILCRHILAVFKNKGMNRIPEIYVSGRWRKIADVTPVHDVEIIELDKYVCVSEVQQLTNKIMSSVFRWIQFIDGNTDQLTLFLRGVDDTGSCVTGQTTQSIVNDKKKAFAKFYESNVPEVISVKPPDVVKTKGSGSRLISRQEKAAKLLLKPKRRCGKCKEMTNHDSRNCDKVASKMKKG